MFAICAGYCIQATRAPYRLYRRICSFSIRVLAADEVLIVGDFNIHVDDEKDALGLSFKDILNSIGVK